MQKVFSSLEYLGLAIFLVVIGMGLAWDASSDLGTGASHAHILIELIFGALAVGAGFIVWLRYLKTKKNIEELRVQLKVSQDSASRWQQQNAALINGLAVAIDKQFEEWNLSVAEKEIALLMLKGLSLKEIGDLRKTSERTVRQQSLNIYAKSGVKGRAELSAFFMEDLILPRDPHKPF